METVILAGGCFWGIEDLFRGLPGVASTRVGYTGGHIPNPTYEVVRTGTSGHAESIEIRFDPSIVSFREILEYFFQIHDPTTMNRQGNDMGAQYRSTVFTLNPKQERIARELIEEMDASGIWPGKIVTTIEPATMFYEAEDYHQDYLVNNPGGYTCHFPRADWRLSKKPEFA
jgi:peptide-methionine (S)-S-oxide reductase